VGLGLWDSPGRTHQCPRALEPLRKTTAWPEGPTGDAAKMASSSSKAKPRGKVAEAEFTSSSGDVRASSVNAKKGLSGEER
jgi:hypothetical protein